METLSPDVILTTVLAVASAIVLLSNAVEKIIKAIQYAKAPNIKQDERIAALEEWKKSVDGKLTRDNEHLRAIDDANRITQRALLALLDHSIDGNNIKQMQHAKEELQEHLINR